VYRSARLLASIQVSKSKKLQPLYFHNINSGNMEKKSVGLGRFWMLNGETIFRRDLKWSESVEVV